MPNIESVQEVLYKALYPYHWIYDNLPLENILQRINMVNNSTDKNTDAIFDARGDAPTLAARLNQSLDSTGELKTVAIDESLHSIASHVDDSLNVTNEERDQLINDTGIITLTNTIDFVRMLSSERDKLSTVASNATAFKMQVETPSSTPEFADSTVVIQESDSIEWHVSGNNVSANFKYATPVLNYYDAIPETADYQAYTTPSSIAYKDGTLRVYINGTRLNPDTAVYVPPDPTTGPTGDWKLFKFSEILPASGTFALSAAITSLDVIRIDFDQAS